VGGKTGKDRGEKEEGGSMGELNLSDETALPRGQRIVCHVKVTARTDCLTFIKKKKGTTTDEARVKGAGISSK